MKKYEIIAGILDDMLENVQKIINKQMQITIINEYIDELLNNGSNKKEYEKIVNHIKNRHNITLDYFNKQEHIHILNLIIEHHDDMIKKLQKNILVLLKELNNTIEETYDINS